MLHNFLSRPLSFLGWTTAMLFWLDFHQTQSNLYKWFRMQRHDWSSMSPKEPMLHLSSSHCTGYQWQLASSSRHWCLHTERPQAQHPPTSTHYYESTSPPDDFVWCGVVVNAAISSQGSLVTRPSHSSTKSFCIYSYLLTCILLICTIYVGLYEHLAKRSMLTLSFFLFANQRR